MLGSPQVSKSRNLRGVSVGLTLLACACGGGESEPLHPTPGEDASSVDSSDGFEPLFDGLSGVEYVGIAPSDVSVVDSELRCTCQPNGYFYRNETFKNFVLKLEFRFERPPSLAPGMDDTFQGNSGYFVYLTPPHGIWPTCLEVQGSYPETGDIFSLPDLGPGNDAPDLGELALARRPVGDWNQLTIHSAEGALSVELNGHVVNSSTPGPLTEGLIAFESEGAEIHWRNVLVQRLP